MHVVPARPSERLLEMLVDSGSDGRPVDVAEHVNEIQVGGDHRLEVTSKDHLFNDTTPMGKGFDSPREANPPLMHAETFLSELHAMFVDKMLCIAGA